MPKSLGPLTIGQKIGNLTILDHVEKNKLTGNYFYKCQCDCGYIKNINAGSLRNNRTKTCGRTKLCNFAFVQKSRADKFHNLEDNLDYKRLHHIIQRCYNPDYPNYEFWGGRGITVYQEWINNPQTFFDYLKTLPETREQFEKRTKQKASLDRINNDGNYEPGNIRWATNQEQNQNRRGIVLNEQLVKFILWEYEINKRTAYKIRDLLPIDCSVKTIYRVIRRVRWTNININMEIAEYRRFGTVNGIKI